MGGLIGMWVDGLMDGWMQKPFLTATTIISPVTQSASLPTFHLKRRDIDDTINLENHSSLFL